MSNLPLRRHLAATKKIKVPNKGLGLHTLQADFPFLARTHSASPHNTVLSPVFAELHVEQFPRQHLAHQSVNYDTARADVFTVAIWVNGKELAFMPHKRT